MDDYQKVCSFPQVLVDSVRTFERSGFALCCAAAEDVAAYFRVGFTLPSPLDMSAAGCFIKKLENIHVFYQPNLEHSINVRGLWMSFGDNNYIFIEVDRPFPSQIRTVVHEVSEKMRAISHLLHPGIPEVSDRYREAWANRVAAAVKMPPGMFLHQVDELGLDLEALKSANEETLAGVARRVRDLVMQGRVYYWCRFDIAPYGLAKCAKLAELSRWLSPICIRVADVTHTSEVNYSRSGVCLPHYNLPTYYQYRLLNPLMSRYIKSNTPVFFETLEGGSSGEFSYHDLFGEHRLCVLLVPYGTGEARGFFLVAVHPRDRHYLRYAIDRLQPDMRGGLDWLFSWYSYTHKQPATAQPQIELPGFGDPLPDLGELFAKQFGREPYLFSTLSEGEAA